MLHLSTGLEKEDLTIINYLFERRQKQKHALPHHRSEISIAISGVKCTKICMYRKN